MGVADKNIRQFLAEAISSSPTPGGANVAALCGAMAASMAGMVAALTLGKKAYAQVQDQAQCTLAQSQKLMQQLQDLADQDIAAFTDFMAAWRLPQKEAAEARVRRLAIQQAAGAAALVPLTIAEACLKVLTLARQAADLGNKMALSDAAGSGCLAWGALQAALLNVEVNLELMSEGEAAADIKQRQSAVLAEGERLHGQIMAAIELR
jgi:formiminotetrahydrofolate cyclodeaminase